MSIPFSQAKLKAQERKAILQAIQTQMRLAILQKYQRFWLDGPSVPS